MKGISFLPCTRDCTWKRKSLLSSNENYFFLMKTPLGTFAIVKAQGNGNGKERPVLRFALEVELIECGENKLYWTISQKIE